MKNITETIHGHHDLVLEVGNLYDIYYGINQGVYEYLGILEEFDGYKWFIGAHLFKNIETGKEFAYYGYTSPYQFTSIVQPH